MTKAQLKARWEKGIKAFLKVYPYMWLMSGLWVGVSIKSTVANWESGVMGFMVGVVVTFFALLFSAHIASKRNDKRIEKEDQDFLNGAEVRLATLDSNDPDTVKHNGERATFVRRYDEDRALVFLENSVPSLIPYRMLVITCPPKTPGNQQEKPSEA